MNETKLEIKLAYINGLKGIVLNEISQYPDLHVSKEGGDIIYLDFIQNIAQITDLRSVLRAYIIARNEKYTPLYISNHKSILGNLINLVIEGKKNEFKTFKIVCAGSDSPEVRSIAMFIQQTYKLTEEKDADLKIHIIKTCETWEIGVQITPIPLSNRNYRARSMAGAMNPTIAYAVNFLSKLESAESYLNIFSGSATLLIEARQCYPNLNKLVGFDKDKKTISLAMQNIKKAGLIKRIQLKEEYICDKPQLGKFDVITADLPFGMLVSKYEDLDSLYKCFIEYCQETLNQGGRLVAYTNEHKILTKIILDSKFKIIKTLELKLLTTEKAYLHPKIFVCELKQN